jgi:hypothetical protein
MQLSTLEEKLFGAMKGFVTRSFDELTKRIDELERREPAKGENGRDGKDADPAFIEQQIAKAQDVLAQRLDAAVARIQLPKDGKDGKSLTADDVRPILTAEVARMELEFERRAGDIIQRAIDKIPAPVNGKDADAEEIAADVLERVSKAMPAPDLGEVVATVFERVMKALPKPENGKDADPALIELQVRRALEAIPRPRDGKSVDPAEVQRMIDSAVARTADAWPKPEKGEKGEDAKPVDIAAIAADVTERVTKSLRIPQDGTSVRKEDVLPELVEEYRKAIAAIPVPKDGNDAEPVNVDHVIAEVVKRIPIPKDGASVTKDDVLPALIAEFKSAVSAIKVPKDGENGKSVTLDEVRPVLDAAAARWELDMERRAADMLQRAIDKLPVPKDGEKGKDGRDGVSLDAFDVSLDDDGQTLIFTLATPECEMVRKVKTPLIVYRGVYSPGHHTKGSSVTYGGSQWIARRDTDNPPPHEDWTLAVKRGRDAK